MSFIFLTVLSIWVSLKSLNLPINLVNKSQFMNFLEAWIQPQVLLEINAVAESIVAMGQTLILGMVVFVLYQFTFRTKHFFIYFGFNNGTFSSLSYFRRVHCFHSSFADQRSSICFFNLNRLLHIHHQCNLHRRAIWQLL